MKGGKASLRNVNTEIKRTRRADKQQYYHNIYKEIESHNQNNQPRYLFRKRRHIERDLKARTWAFEDHTGILRTNREDIAETWKLFCQDLYKDDQRQELVHQTPEEIKEEPNILENEIRLAISNLKYNKAPGSDMITAEMLKATEETGIELLYLLCYKIWHAKQWPDD
ncbi:uncharacterized protein [Diabrotica undecimpunctata]|uniref:uncharacterized protein n=1 Tax=Diabrotica undecimpunctata TaxID=50387 RepID=UPI003B63245D